MAPITSVNSVATSLSPLSLSTAPTSPALLRSVLDGDDSMFSGMGGMGLDDIAVSVVMDHIIGNPVYQIGPLDANPALLADGYSVPLFAQAGDPVLDTTLDLTLDLASDPTSGQDTSQDMCLIAGQDLINDPVSSVTPFEAGYVPHFNTELATAPLASSSTSEPMLLLPSDHFFMPEMTVEQSHQLVNFVLAYVSRPVSFFSSHPPIPIRAR